MTCISKQIRAYHASLEGLDTAIQARRHDQLLHLFHWGFVCKPSCSGREGPSQGDVAAQAAEGSTAGYRVFVVVVYFVLACSSVSLIRFLVGILFRNCQESFVLATQLECKLIYGCPFGQGSGRVRVLPRRCRSSNPVHPTLAFLLAAHRNNTHPHGTEASGKQTEARTKRNKEGVKEKKSGKGHRFREGVM